MIEKHGKEFASMAELRRYEAATSCGATPQEFKTYGFEYRYGNSMWSINIPAGSETEARDRLIKASYGHCLGALEATIPAYPGAGLLTRLIVWWRNR